LPWVAKPSGVAPASRRAAMSCRQQPALRAQKCCSACAKTRRRKVTAAVKALAGAMAVAVVVAAARDRAETAAKVVVLSKHRAPRVHVRRKAKATDKGAVAPLQVMRNHAATKAASPAAWAMNPVRHVLSRDNLTRCAPVSI